jgi:hypothetical protein
MVTNAFLVKNLQNLSAANREALPHLKTIRSSPAKSSDGVVLCIARDEADLLPHFLKHYREIGVKRFAFVDNGSTDQTLPLLLDQSDCDVFQFAGGFKNFRGGMIWKNLLILTYMSAKWFFSADVDEHAVYDGWPGASLDEFAHRMSSSGRSAVTALMVDMYGEGPIVGTHIGSTRSLLEACPLFDGDGYEITPPESSRAHDFFKQIAHGGPMFRIFGKKSSLAKTPLILEPNIYFHDSHTVLPAGLNFTPMEIALLHFRFSASLVSKVSRVLDHRQHAENNISYYEKLGVKMRDNPKFSFLYPGSVEFKTPRQFIDRSMIGRDSLSR